MHCKCKVLCKCAFVISIDLRAMCDLGSANSSFLIYLSYSFLNGLEKSSLVNYKLKQNIELLKYD